MYAIMDKTSKKTPEHNTIQRRASFSSASLKPNRTGLPDSLKRGIENMSGYSMDDVRVHYNSSKPAQLQALAYTRGTEIHIAPGQEMHLPHETWHVVQQMQGRVRPTVWMNHIPVNDDLSLEHEADVMGAKAAVYGSSDVKPFQLRKIGMADNNAGTFQCRKAILGRRVEPYRKDIDGFKSFCEEINADSEKKLQLLNYMIIIVVNKNKDRKKYADNDIVQNSDKLNEFKSLLGNDNITDAVFNKYIIINKTQNATYKNSVNMLVKQKIAKTEKTDDSDYDGKINDYKHRVLDMDNWTIENNQEWISSGKTGNYDSNSGSGINKSIGIGLQGAFRLVGMENINGAFEKTGELPKDMNYPHKTVTFYKLKTAKFFDNQKELYRSTLYHEDSEKPNFIAHVINNKPAKDLLYTDGIPKKIFKLYESDKVFPTVLAQEMEQLRESNYVFAKIENNEDKKVVAYPSIDIAISKNNATAVPEQAELNPEVSAPE